MLTRVSPADLRTALADASVRGDVVASLRGTGALVVSAPDGRVFPDASSATEWLFSLPLYALKPTFHRVAEVAGGLTAGFGGYHEPAPSKAVFRIRRGFEQRWPEADVDTAELDRFRTAQLRALDALEEIVDAVLDVLDAEVSASNLPPLPRRFRDPHSRLPRTHPTSATTASSVSPYDLFRYHNTPAVARSENCAEHVDPGVLTCVPCAATPGLALRMPRTCLPYGAADEEMAEGWWWAAEDPEAAFQPSLLDLCAPGRPSGPARLVPGHDILVIVDDALAEATKGKLDLPAVAHRVDKADRRRYSVVYERRPVRDHPNRTGE
ncbi:hypothetical protein DFJ74DRAFT_718347 [Hyaloraphidium curvatum]|nr:hypothetical protein DFJ74DRAFT_718347 [Hyaloraphidium curvatum]